MKSPAILFYTSDFLIGTTFMSNEEVGKYIKLLCMQHQQGHISEEDFYTICSKQDIKVIEKFKLDKNNKYFNKRMDEEIDKRLNYSKSRSSNRKENPNKTKEKQDNHMNNICKSYEQHMENENDNDNSNTYYKNIELNKIFIEYLSLRKKLKAINSETAIKLLKNKLEPFSDETKIKMIENSIQNSWKSVFEIKDSKKMSDPTWLNKEIKSKEMSVEEEKELQDSLKEFS